MTERLADALNVPGEFFHLPVTETHEGFFRSLRRTSLTHRRHARAVAHIAHDIAQTIEPSQLPPVSIPCLPVADLEAPRAELEEVAARARVAMGLPAGPVPNVVQTLEDHGLIVIRPPLETADVDAFSLPFHDRPIVVLGADKNDRARSRFDAAHELGHLVAHGDQVWSQRSRAASSLLRSRFPDARRRHHPRTPKPGGLATALRP
jgi:hypothetical protein